MANSDLKTKLTIEADAQGSEEIIRLRQQVDKLGAAADEASPEFAQLSEELKRLGQSQAAIAQFERLKTSTEQTAKQLQQLQQATRDAALALKEQERAVAQATAANHKTGEQLKQQRAYQDELRTSIKALAAEYKAQAQAAKASGDASAQTQERMADTRAQLAVLRAEYKSASAEVTQLGKAQRENAKALDAANKAQDKAAGEFERLRKQTRQAQEALDAQNTSLQQARDRLGDLGIASTGLSQAQAEVSRSLAGAHAQIARLAEEAQRAAEVMADRDLLGVRAHADIQKEIDATRAAYERLKASGTLTQKELAQAALKTEERIQSLKQQTNGWVQTLGNAKAQMIGLGASIGGLASAVSKAVEFEGAMADVAKVVDGTDEQLRALAARIREMTREIPLAASELAQMAAAGGQLGVPLQQLDEFVRLSAQMATAFNISADQAGQAVAKLSNIFKLPLQQVRELGDAINTLGNTTAAKEADIVEVLTRIGGTASQFGLTARQAAALAASMLSLGGSAEVAGTGINAILSKLQTANVQGKDFQAALQRMGVSAQQLAADIQEHPQRALNEFLHTLSQLEGAEKAEILSGLFGTEYQDDVARLLAGLDGYGAALQRIGDASQTAGAMQKEFEARVKTTGAQITLMKNALNEVMINLGSAFLPIINGAASALQNISQVLAGVAEQFPLLSQAAAILALMGTNATALGLVIKSVGVLGAQAMAGISGAVAGVLKTLPALTSGMRGAAAATTALATSAKAAGAAGALALGPIAVAAAAAAASIGALIYQYRQYREELRQQQESSERLVQLQGRQAQLLREISAATGVVVTSMQELNAAQERGALVFDEASGKWESAAQAQERLAKASKATAWQLAQTNAQKAVAEFDKLKASSSGLGAELESTAAALQKMLAGLDVSKAESVGGLVLAMDQLRSQGKITAEEFGDAWQKALELDAGKLLAFQASVEAAAAQGILTARQAAQANGQILQQAFAQLNINAAQALGRISEQAQQAILGIDLIAASAKAAGVGVEAAARSMELAFEAAIPRADSLQAIEALEKRLKAAGAAGEIGAEGIARVQAALDKQRAAIEEQLPGIQSLEEALKQLGVTPQKELDRLAQSAREAFEAVKNSGQATPREINEAWKAMAEAAIEANDGVATAALKAEAKQHGFAIETDKAGKAIVKSMEEAKEATEGVGEAAEQSAEQMAEMARQGWDASRDLAEQARQHNAALKTVEGSWVDAQAAASEYSEQLARVVWQAGRAIAEMRAEHAALVAQMEALAEQQRQIDLANNDAVRGLEALRLRYLELTGDQAAAAQLKMQLARQEIDLKIALMEIDLQRAQIAGDETEAQKLALQINALKEQLDWLKKIHAEEERQRKARAREEARRGGQAGSGGGAGSGAGALPPP
ncbi:phage tail tape measure protein, partial [Comamonadaceae bacterium OH2310_COT-174]